jgi:glutathione synthase/RimK-type ligase-like ATP-grasp enzyme
MTALLLRRRKLGLGSCRGIKQFSQTGIDFIRNDKVIPADTSLIFRWGCTSNVPHGATVVNSAKAIHFVADKRTSRIVFAEADLAPKTWATYEDWYDGVWDYHVRELGWGGDDKFDKGFVVRRATHHQGRYLHMCHTYNEMVDACNLYNDNNYYISEYIPKVAEYRVFIAQGRVVWVTNKTPDNPDAIAWNVAKGGRFDNVRWGDWPLRVVRTAREAFLLSGLDFGGVDVMVGPDGKCYVLEINSAPSQTSPYRQQCTAKAFDYIVQHGKGDIPVTEEKGGWKKFIHPALSEEAIMV